MTVNPGWGGQAFMSEVLPKLAALRDEADRRGLTCRSRSMAASTWRPSAQPTPPEATCW